MSKLTVKQAAVRANVSANLIYELCASKRLAHYRVPTPRGKILIDETDLDAFFAACRVGPMAPATAVKSPPVRFKHLRV